MGQIASKNLVNTLLRPKFLLKSSSNLTQNFCLDDILGQVGIWVMLDKNWVTRSNCLKPCSPSRGHSFASIFMKLYQNVCLDNILVKFDHGWDGVKK